MLILKFLIFAIPVTLAAILHMVAVKINLFPFLKLPLDFHKTYNGKRIFGDHKTFRGVILMIIFSVFGVYFLQFLVYKFDSIERLNILLFDQYSPIFYGVLFGLGYTIAELPNSFAKRQIEIPEGKRGSIFNIIMDQIDSPIGCMIIIAAFSNMSVEFFIFGLFFSLIIHLVINFLLYLMKLRQNPL